MKKISKGLVSAAIVLLFGCVTDGPDKAKEKPKSKLNYLNGEHYGTNVNLPGNGVPLNPTFYRRDKVTTISGTLVVKEGIILAPINHEKLILINSEGKKVAETMSGAAGKFQFQQSLKNDKYSIELESKKYQGKISVQVSTYEVKDLKLVANKN